LPYPLDACPCVLPPNLDDITPVNEKHSLT
jgi:hypothetical protein